jgi:hypothetical protein
MVAGKRGLVTSTRAENPVFFGEFLYNTALTIQG